MAKPYLPGVGKRHHFISAFRGYNHNLVIDEAESYDEQNMTADFYPVMSPRRKRGFIRTFGNPHILYTKDKLAWVDGTRFYYNGAYVGEVSDTDKQMCKMGALLVIWPDKKVYNTETGAFEELEAAFSTVADVSFTLCRYDGEAYEGYETGISAPATPAPGALWLDTSQTPAVLKQYSDTYEAWIAVVSTYVKITSTGIGELFNEGDGVTVSGCKDEQFNTDLIVQKADPDALVVIGVINTPFIQQPDEGAITVKRVVPDMDFVTESNNRIWGCSSKAHEIYACKQGDPKNWRCYEGIASDSYAVTVGSDGDFTGAITHQGTVLFFKEDVIHKLYGTKPANYQISDLFVRGVQKGSERSLVIVNETLYYKSRNGICVYDGSLPMSISDKLGFEHYEGAVGGTVGDKYYVSMRGEDGSYTLFVYDEAKALWHKEDSTRVQWFARQGGELYYIDGENRLCAAYGTTALYEAEAEEAQLEKDVEWFVETGDIGMQYAERKYIGRIMIRMDLPVGAFVAVDIMTDSSGVWKVQNSFTQDVKGTRNVMVIPQRCDHFKLRIRGKGDVKIYSIDKTISEGGVMYGRR